MKSQKKTPPIPKIVRQAEQALREAVAEVYAESARTGEPLPIWDEAKAKVVWIVPGKKSRNAGRAAQSRRNGKNRDDKK